MRGIQNKKARRSLPQVFGRFFEQGLFAPLLFALEPVLDLYFVNGSEVYLSETFRALFVSLLFGAIVLGLAYLLTHHWQKASVVASLFLVLFFRFGGLSDWIMEKVRIGPVRADVLTLALVSVAVIFWVWLAHTRIQNIASINLYFNLLSILFLLSSVSSLKTGLLGTGLPSNQDDPSPVIAMQSTTPRPDIYYIILDGYGRQDILQSLYGFDNSAFLNALGARGFYIAEESSSNYVQTMLSVSSSLNMEYLQSLGAQGATLESRQDLVQLLKQSKVRDLLAQQGYRLVSFRNSYNATIPDAEVYHDDTGFAYPITPFESIVIDRTLARVLPYIPFFHRMLIEMPYDTHRSQILSTFATLQEIPSGDGDYFVYAHVIAPHPPFVFDATGAAVPHREPFKLADGNNYIKNHSRDEYVNGYREQLQYINTLVLETVDTILSTSETPPIIILQGDHGPGSRLHQGSLKKTLPAERFGILNAYYFPDQNYATLYPSISPVNSFRIVLDQYFGEEYTPLPDRYYYSQWGYPFDFTEVTDLRLP